MENETPMMVVTCPECAKKMRMKNPQKPGVYRLTCPFCNKPFPVKIVDNSESKNAAPKPATPPVPPIPPVSPQPQQQPQPQPAKDDEPVVIQYCSSCGMKLRIRNPQPGQHSVRCPKCQSVQTYTYGTPAPAQNLAQPTPAPQTVNKTKPVQGNYNLATGCLVQSRGIFRADAVHPLAGKETIIGRRANASPCDIMIDDATMSRRSVSIIAEAKNTGIAYKFTVLNATNPVLHNGKPLPVGSSVYLNFGDTLVLGRTKFKFQKAQEQH